MRTGRACTPLTRCNTLDFVPKSVCQGAKPLRIPAERVRTYAEKWKNFTISGCSFIGEYGILGLVQQIRIDKITQTGMNEDVREYLLEMISGWSIQFEEGNPQNFVLINKQIRVLLINGLHSVGLFSLETLNIALLKNISNDLGWMLINALQQDYPEVQLLLDSVIDLYRKSVIFGVAFNIRIYLLTLFTTVGAFCQTDSKYNPTGDAVISFLKEIPHDMIDLAIDVRKNDYDGWDNDEFGNIKNGVAILKGKLAT